MYNARISVCILYNARILLCACMRNALIGGHRTPPLQPHNSLSDRPPEIYVPMPPLDGGVSSLYIHIHRYVRYYEIYVGVDNVYETDRQRYMYQCLH